MSANPLALPDPGRSRREERRELPEYLPARMVNEFVYCPRLFFYEWVDGVFAESADTLEGSVQHRRVDRGSGELAPPDDESEEKIHARSVTLSSERLKVIAKLDLVEAEGATATPVDYKHGKPREARDGSGLELWPSDRVQLALQAITLRENGYACHEAVVFYQKTRQRVRIAITPELIADAEEAVARAWECAARPIIPSPLADSPKCAGCSLNAICLPDETNRLVYGPDLAGASQLDLFEEFGRKPPARETNREVRLLMTPRDDRKPVYLNTQGLRVGKSGDVLQVKDKEATVQEIRIGELCQVNLLGNIQITTQAVQALCESGVPVSYFSMGGWFYGITTGMNTKNINLRRAQFQLADSEWFARSLARSLVAGKIRNQRVMLQRNHLEPRKSTLAAMKALAESAESAGSLETLLGIEGTAARYYFGEFSGMIKVGNSNDGEDFDGGTAEPTAPPALNFDFEGRNRRPPRDPVNALLSLAYSMLSKDLTIACYAVGFDPYMGYFHQIRHGRPALALDLMEPFRPLIADSAVLSAMNTRMITSKDFVRAGESVALTAAGRKGFYRAYEARMNTLVTHPLFDYRVSYRRLLDIQVRLLARVVEGEIPSYPVFVTR